MADEKKNLFQRLDEARVKIGIINKNLFVVNYKAVDETTVLKAVNTAEHECGLYSYPCNTETVDYKEYAGSNGRLTTRVRIKVTVRVVNIDAPTEFVEFQGFGTGLDTGDKADGKAMTYANKYALMKGYKIPTGEDPDYFKTEMELDENEIKVDDTTLGILKELIGEDRISKACEKLKVKSLKDLSQKKAEDLINKMENK